MARGWESKAVEDQIGAAEAERDVHAKPTLSPQDRERQTRKQSLQLSRSRVLSQLDAAQNERYRDQLKRTLEYLNAQLQDLE